MTVRSLVLKRDEVCVICKLQNRSDGRNGTEMTNLLIRRSSSHRGSSGCSDEDSKARSEPGSGECAGVGVIPQSLRDSIANPSSNNGLHVHHEYGTYGDEYWPRRDVPEKCVMLCATHHALRHQYHPTIDRDIRKYLKSLHPDYNFGVRYNDITANYDIPIGEF